jgi:hypothetical protein
MEEFKEWLKRKNKKENSINSICARINRIAKEYDIEHEYSKDKCAEMLYDFTYTSEDADNGILPNVKLQIKGSYIDGLSSLKSALKLYVEYLDESKWQGWSPKQNEREVATKNPKSRKRKNEVVSFFVGSFDDFNTYVGPKCRNIVQVFTKPLKQNAPVCECCRQRLPLDAAHKHGYERLDIIKRLLDKGTIIAPGIYRVDLAEFERAFANEHQPIVDKIYFLCKKCHSRYDKGTAIEQQQVENDVLANRQTFGTP